MKTVEYNGDNPWVRVVSCPNCAEKVSAWVSSGMSESFPHFYCDRCSNVYHDAEGKQEILANTATPELLEKLEVRLPGCPCGGCFRAAANPKCPHCGQGFQHQHNALQRLSDPHMIVVDQACVLGSKSGPYKVVITEK